MNRYLAQLTLGLLLTLLALNCTANTDWQELSTNQQAILTPFKDNWHTLEANATNTTIVSCRALEHHVAKAKTTRGGTVEKMAYTRRQSEARGASKASGIQEFT